MDTTDRCREAIFEHAELLDLPGNLGRFDPYQILAAFAHNESYYGRYNKPRVERVYSPGGYYFLRAEHVRLGWQRYGDDAAASWGSFQLLWVVAFELGFRGAPDELADDFVGLPWAIKLLNRRIVGRGARTLAEMADAYNSGSFKDQNVPHEYIRRFLAAYESDKTLRFLDGGCP